jgi:hypothetical protein
MSINQQTTINKYELRIKRKDIPCLKKQIKTVLYFQKPVMIFTIFKTWNVYQTTNNKQQTTNNYHP